MIVTTDDMRKAVEESKAIAEASKRLIEPTKPVQSPLDQRFEAARRARQK